MSQQVPPSTPSGDREPDRSGPGQPTSQRPERPVLWGLVALVGVGLVIGLLATLGATVGLRAVGLTGGTQTTSSQSPDDGASMYLPTPSPTGKGRDGRQPLISAGPNKQPQKSGKGAKKKGAKKAISLSAGQESVSSMGRIDLVGTYKGGEGAVLDVQRKQDGSWSDFPVSATVSDGEFSTYVQTGRAGKNVFRVKDTDSSKVSNAVTVKVG